MSTATHRRHGATTATTTATTTMAPPPNPNHHHHAPQLIKKLYTEKAEAEGNAKKLEAQNKKLRETLKQRKARITVLEGQVKRNGGRPASASKGVVSSPTRAAASGGGADGEEEAVARAASNAKLGDLVTRLGSRLENAEQTLTRVREENRKLRAERDEMRGTGADADDMAAAGARNAISIEPRSGEKASLQLQRELQDTKAQLHLLQTRYDHLEAKARAQTELQQGSFDQLEDYNKQIRRLRGVLQDLNPTRSRPRRARRTWTRRRASCVSCASRTRTTSRRSRRSANRPSSRTRTRSRTRPSGWRSTSATSVPPGSSSSTCRRPRRTTTRRSWP